MDKNATGTTYIESTINITPRCFSSGVNCTSALLYPLLPFQLQGPSEYRSFLAFSQTAEEKCLAWMLSVECFFMTIWA